MVVHNLPAPSYTEFIGRELEQSTLLERLSSDHAAHIITVNGIGGVGKTALALKVAYLCLEASQNHLEDGPKFEAIIFTSAKQQILTPYGIVAKSQQVQRNLSDIFREVANTLEDRAINQVNFEDQPALIRRRLAQRRTLLIVDNMEIMQDRVKQDVIEFLYDLPINVKVIITSRERIALFPIVLKNLPLDDGLQLINQKAEENKIKLSKEESKILYNGTGGIPLAILYVIGQLYNGYSLEAVLNKLTSADSDISHFCFKDSVEFIKDSSAYKLLMTQAIFPECTIKDVLIEIADINSTPSDVEDGLMHLKKLFLLTDNNDCYSMLPLTREYAIAELKANPNFEKEVRERWIAWYLKFANKYGGEDWNNWYNYEKLEQEADNFRAILIWCKNEGLYKKVAEFWLLLNHYANLYGYWPDRMNWLEWLIEKLEQFGEWSELVKFMFLKSWLLIRFDSEENLKEADNILMNAWTLSSHFVEDPCVKADVSESIARLKIRQRIYCEAYHWLNIEEELVKNADIDRQKYNRYIIPVLYHRAEINFLEGKYVESKKLFKDVIEKAKIIEWVRVTNSAQNWLADIAIQEQDKEGAEKLLTTGLLVAERNKNERRRARYLRSKALWEEKWGNKAKAYEYASQAMDIFIDFKMNRERAMMETILNRLE